MPEQVEKEQGESNEGGVVKITGKPKRSVKGDVK